MEVQDAAPRAEQRIEPSAYRSAMADRAAGRDLSPAERQAMSLDERIATARAAAVTPPAFLQDFRVTGVIDTGGQREAVVTYKQLSGSLRPGDRGGRTTDLLPYGWSVASVDVANGSLILQSGSRRVKVEI